MTTEMENGISPVIPQPLRLPTRQRWRKWRTIGVVLATQATLLALLLGFWEHMTASDKQAAFMFGSPSAIFRFLGQMARDGSLWRDTYVTGLETLLGFVMGNFFGTLIGLLLWYSRFVSRVVEPFVIALGSIPIIALAPIIIIWF